MKYNPATLLQAVFQENFIDNSFQQQ